MNIGDAFEELKNDLFYEALIVLIPMVKIILSSQKQIK